MKSVLFYLLMSFSFVLTAQDAPKAPSSCNCIYPLKANVDNINWCTGPKGGKYCVNKNNGKTYRSSVVKNQIASKKPTQTAKDL